MYVGELEKRTWASHSPTFSCSLLVSCTKNRVCRPARQPSKRTVLFTTRVHPEKAESVAYNLEEGDYDADYPLTAQLARSSSGPLLDLACGTGMMAIRMVELGQEMESLLFYNGFEIRSCL